MLPESISRKRFVSREIRVAFRPGGRGPVGHRRWFGKRPANPEPLHEVRVADEGSPEGDQVGVSRGNRFLCRLLGVAAVADEWAVEHLAELGQGHRLTESVEAERQPVYDVQVRKPEPVELTGDERKLLPVVRRPHIVVCPIGREVDADPVGGPDGRNHFDYFLQKAITILDAPAVLACAVVRLRLKEGIDKIAVGPVDFHAVEPCFLRSLGSSPVVLHDPWNLGRFQRPWDFVRLVAAGRMDVRLVDLDGRGSDGGLAAVETAVGGTASMPKLEEDQSALFMYGVCGVFPLFGHLVRVDARRLIPTVRLLGDCGGLGDEQARRTALGVVFGHQAVREAGGPGPGAGHGGQNDPIRQGQVV